ncbi:MAG TPA: hypothetical protein VFO38_02215 [Candidatus Saccharimonadales bacterium]|nr:hypothetical protein [Candidatus Saccharimonadales bacterium]
MGVACSDESHKGIDFLRSRLAKEGFDLANLKALAGDPRQVDCLIGALQGLRPDTPWLVPFAFMARAEWRGLDGFEAAGAQIRVAANVVQVRLPLSCNSLPGMSHEANDCPNCWTTPREFVPGPLWRTVSHLVQIRVPEPVNSATGTCRVEVRRRFRSELVIQPEAAWSAPTHAPFYTKSRAFQSWSKGDRGPNASAEHWVDVAPDVQVLVRYPHGILVRCATALNADESAGTAWATPVFIGDTQGEWVSAVPGADLEVRFWEREVSGSMVAVRQKTGRQPVLLVEPHWGEIALLPCRGRHTLRGYELEVIPHRGENGISRRDIRVTNPRGATYTVAVTDQWVKIAPDLRMDIVAGTLRVQRGTYEPPVQPVRWGPVATRRLDDQWVYLTDMVRVRTHKPGESVEISLNADGKWQPANSVPVGTVHELSTLRATFTAHCTVEFQLVCGPDAE